MATHPKNKAGIHVVQQQPRGALRPPEGGVSPPDCHAQVRSVLMGTLRLSGLREQLGEELRGGPLDINSRGAGFRLRPLHLV